jgi:hypothetical protein
LEEAIGLGGGEGDGTRGINVVGTVNEVGDVTLQGLLILCAGNSSQQVKYRNMPHKQSAKQRGMVKRHKKSQTTTKKLTACK